MNLEEDLITFGKLWDEAIVSNNHEWISTFMSDDWVIVGTSGGITDKETFLNWISSGEVQHTRMDSDKSHIKIYGNNGIVISRGMSAGNYKGELFSLYEWSMSVFIHNGKNWICIATMLTEAHPD